MIKAIIHIIGRWFHNIGAALLELSGDPGFRAEMPTLPDPDSTQKIEVPRWH